MDRLQLIKRIAEMHPQLKTKEAELTVKVILDALCGTLAKGGRIEIRGFGSFSLNQRSSKQKRNPKTGGKLKEPAKYFPHFKPAKELRARTSKGNRAGIAEIFLPLQISTDQLNRDATNDMEQTANYA